MENFYVHCSKGTNHEGADDVAIIKATSLDDACRKFRKIYSNASQETVCMVEFNKYGVMIVSDY